MGLGAGGELEAVVGGIVKEELLGGGEPVAAQRDFTLLPPIQDFLVVEAQVGQRVVGAGEGGHESREVGQLRFGKGDFRALGPNGGLSFSRNSARLMRGGIRGWLLGG